MSNGKIVKVLIVDDEERFRATTSAILKKRGFEVSAVGSGLEAIEEVKNKPFDVVILDLKMPGMDGHEAFREIRKINKDVEIIMLTGHGTPDSALTGLRDGVFDYLSKPCDVDLLVEKIRDACEKKAGVSKVEHRVRDIMVPLTTFSTIHEDKTIAEAIEIIEKSFHTLLTTTTIRESVHRSILVLNKKEEVIGVLSFTDILQGLYPPYMKLLEDRPSLAHTISITPPSYRGLFTVMARDLAKKKVRELMSEAPPVIDADDNLMEAVNRLLGFKVRRLLVMEGSKCIGVIREQDLFFELAHILKHET